jgi:hypothetical protein
MAKRWKVTNAGQAEITVLVQRDSTRVWYLPAMHTIVSPRTDFVAIMATFECGRGNIELQAPCHANQLHTVMRGMVERLLADEHLQGHLRARDNVLFGCTATPDGRAAIGLTQDQITATLDEVLATYLESQLGDDRGIPDGF